ncbi:conserved hypothetical protein [Psychromonas ingrahamii 37]|uniref:Inner membrane protein n=1 Tax=Psychromonas ingrahamii (strain DSM 17664 / CCUG 51855 / 37) TaxID=357804 RepID=A1SZY4_PSYIN|nr:DUF454 family protein [Psychromonas ingrahamii]ABM05049.1 conserved hypothetical protein [Psychromonas ingrahamii 37]
MHKQLYRYLVIFIGGLSILLGLLGIILPLLPTTPFFILALSCFARSSPYFHQKLLKTPYLGATLQDWEKHKKIDKKRKLQIYLVVLSSFLLSILILRESFLLQLLLLLILSFLLFFIHRIDEK